MSTLNIRIQSVSAQKAGLLAALKSADLVKTAPATSSLNFVSYDDMHRVLAPARLKIVKVLAGQGVLSIREVARRVDRDAQAVHRDVQTLIRAGVIDRDEKGVEFPYDRIHFDFDVSVAA